MKIPKYSLFRKNGFKFHDFSSEHVTPSLRREHPQHPILSYLDLNVIWKKKERCASGLLARQTLEYMREVTEMVAN